MMKTRDYTKISNKENNKPQVHKLMNKDDKFKKQNTITTKDSEREFHFVQSTYNIRQSKQSPL